MLTLGRLLCDSRRDVFAVSCLTIGANMKRPYLRSVDFVEHIFELGHKFMKRSNDVRVGTVRDLPQEIQAALEHGKIGLLRFGDHYLWMGCL